MCYLVSCDERLARNPKHDPSYLTQYINIMSGYGLPHKIYIHRLNIQMMGFLGDLIINIWLD